MESICGINCDACCFKDGCGGCKATDGRPFGKKCMVAECVKSKGSEGCEHCPDAFCGLKVQLIKEFHALGIEDMAEITNLNALTGSFVNRTYSLANGQRVKLLDDNKIYLGCQLPKKDSGRCYGLAADESYLLVCEYGENGSDAEIVVYKRR